MNKKTKIDELLIDEEFSKLIPPLTDEEFNTLRESIISEGCRDPLVLWDNIILDGHNRYRICMENNLIFKRVEKNFDNREDAKVWIIRNQMGRRNLTDGWKYELKQREREILSQKGKERLKTNVGGNHMGLSENDKGIDHNTQKILAEKLNWSTGKVAEADIIRNNNPSLWEEVKSGNKTIEGAYKEHKTFEKQQKRVEESKQSESIQIDDKEIDLRYGEFTKVLNDIPDGSVNLILTDPPYPIEFIDEWKKLGEFAKQKLKKNGYCICYCGHKNLFESMKHLNNYLNYYWTFALILKGNTQLISFNNIKASWKPILIYQNGYKKNKNIMKDVIEGSGRSKDNTSVVNGTDWQQSEYEIVSLISNFSKEGALVVDPFAGSGTTLIVSKKMNRKCIGAEKDKTTFNIAKKRIKDNI